MYSILALRVCTKFLRVVLVFTGSPNRAVHGPPRDSNPTVYRGRIRSPGTGSPYTPTVYRRIRVTC